MLRLPGELVYVASGAYLRSLVTNEERWNESICMATVVATGHPHVVESDENVEGFAVVLIPNVGLYFVEETCLMTQDQYADPNRLFPVPRLREW